MAIRDLPVVTDDNPLSLSAVFPVSPANSANASYQATAAQLLALFQSSATDSTFTVQSASVTTGNIVAVTAAVNTWLILTTTSIASLTIRLPDSVTAFDGQEVIITIDGAVASLSIGANGLDTSGQPASCDSEGLGVRMRFNSAAGTWFCVTNHGNSFASIRLASGIRDDQNNEVIDVVGVGSAVNQVSVTNAATGNAPIIAAAGDDTNIGLTVVGKGTGALNLGQSTGVTTVDGLAGGSAGRFQIVKMTPRTLAQLQALSTSLGNPVGLTGWCSDSVGVVYAANTVGGGAVNQPVYFDGTNWKNG